MADIFDEVTSKRDIFDEIAPELTESGKAKSSTPFLDRLMEGVFTESDMHVQPEVTPQAMSSQVVAPQSGTPTRQLSSQQTSPPAITPTSSPQPEVPIGKEDVGFDISSAIPSEYPQEVPDTWEGPIPEAHKPPPIPKTEKMAEREEELYRAGYDPSQVSKIITSEWVQKGGVLAEDIASFQKANEEIAQSSAYLDQLRSKANEAINKVKASLSNFQSQDQAGTYPILNLQDRDKLISEAQTADELARQYNLAVAEHNKLIQKQKERQAQFQNKLKMPLPEYSPYQPSKSDPWGKVIRDSLSSLKHSAIAGLFGALGMVEELSPNKELMNKYGIEDVYKSFSEAATGLAKESQPYVQPGTMKAWTANAIQSVGLNLPLMMAGALTGSVAMPLVGMGILSAGQSYTDMRKEMPEASKALVALASTGKGVVEGLSELMPAVTLLRKDIGFGKKLFNEMVQELGGESANSLYGSIVDKLTTNPNMTMGELIQNQIDTFMTTLIATPMMVGATHPVVKFLEKKQAELIKADQKRVEDYVKNLRDKYETKMEPLREQFAPITEDQFRVALENRLKKINYDEFGTDRRNTGWMKSDLRSAEERTEAALIENALKNGVNQDVADVYGLRLVEAPAPAPSHIVPEPPPKVPEVDELSASEEAQRLYDEGQVASDKTEKIPAVRLLKDGKEIGLYTGRSGAGGHVSVMTDNPEINELLRKDSSIVPVIGWLEYGKFVVKGEPTAVPKNVPALKTLEGVPYSEEDVPIAELRLSKDVPNFKENADKATGIVQGEQLKGGFDELGTAPIVVWERLNGDKEVITGRHRFDLAKRTPGKKTIKAHVVKEADGFTKEQAMVVDAEQNIKDEKGTVKDYARYFRAQRQLDERTARERGLLSRSKQNTGWILGKNASGELFSNFTAGTIGAEQAAAIAKAAPQDEGLQRAGMWYVNRNKNASEHEIAAFLTDIKNSKVNVSSEQIDMFGDDSKVKLVEAKAKLAAKKVSEFTRERAALALGKKSKEMQEAARRAGIDVQNPDQVKARINELNDLIDKWSGWATNPELSKQLEDEIGAQNEREGKETGKVRTKTVQGGRKPPEELRPEGRGPGGNVPGGPGGGEGQAGQETAGRPNADIGFGKNNKIFTEDKANRAREILRKKLGGINMGVPLDPETIQAGIELAGYYIEGGARSFVEYSQKMIGDFGDKIRPYLKQLYMAVRYHPGFDTKGMNNAAELENIDENKIAVSEKKEEPETAKQPQKNDRIIVARKEYTATEKDVDKYIPANILDNLSYHQAQGVTKALKAMENGRGFLFADGTGVGKTREMLAIAAIRAAKGEAVVIFAPNEALGKPFANKNIISGSYANDARQMGIKIRLTDGKEVIEKGKIYVSTYNRLDNFQDKNVSYMTLIFDEAHAMKNILSDTKQAKKGFSLAERAKNVVFATATPADKPHHIPYLARIGIYEGKTMAEQMMDLGLYQKEIKVGKGAFQKTIKVWAVNPQVGIKESLNRLAELFDRITKNGLMIKREINMDGVEVDFIRIKLPEEAHEAINNIERGFASSVGAKSVWDIPGLKKAVALMHMRRQQEPYKIDAAVDIAKKELAEGRQVIIFLSRINHSVAGQKVKIGELYGGEPLYEYVEYASSEGTAKTLKERLEQAGIKNVVELHGNAGEKAADAMQKFQSGKANVIIATMESGGTGINLDDVTGDKPRTMIVMTAPFSAVQNIQAAGRVWRLTTVHDPKNPTRIKMLFGDTETDDWNAGIIAKKMKMLNATVKGEVEKLDVSKMDEIDYEDVEKYSEGNKDVRSAEGNVISEPSVREITPRSSGESKQVMPEVTTARTTFIKTGIEKITSLDDVAAIARHLTDSPQEIAAVVIADKNGKVLSVLHHAKGGIGVSQVYAGVLGGSILNIPEAKKIWFVHNHPSKNVDVSDSDRKTTDALRNLFEGTRIKLEDSIIVSPDKYSSVISGETKDYSPSEGNIKIPVIERKFKTQGSGEAKISSTLDTVNFISNNPDFSGLILIDSGMKIVGAIPESFDLLNADYTQLRGRLQEEILKEAEKRNAAYMMVVAPKRELSAAEIRNLARFSNASTGMAWLFDIVDKRGSHYQAGRYPLLGEEGIQFTMAAPISTQQKQSPESQKIVDKVDELTAKEPRQGYSPDEIAAAYKEATGKEFPYRMLVPILNKLGVRISFKAKKIKRRFSAAAVYDPDTKEIIFNENVIRWADDPIRMYEEIVSHEAIHAVVVNLKTLDMPAYIELRSKLNAFTKELEPHLSSADYLTQRAFGRITENNLVDEIVNLAFTNKNFAAWLNSIPTEKGADKSQTLWGKLKEIILKVVGQVTGMKKSKLDELNAIMDRFLAEPVVGISDKTGFQKAMYLPKYAEGSSINLDRIDTTDEIKDFLEKMTKANEEEIGKRRMSWEEIEQIAKEMGWDYKELIKQAKKKGAFTAAEIQAMRKLHMIALHDLYRSLKNLPDDTSKRTDAMRLELLDKINNYVEIMKITSQKSSEAGRALNIHRKMVFDDPDFAKDSFRQKVLDKMMESLGGRNLTDDMLNDFKNIDFDNPAEVHQMIQKYHKAKITDMFYEAWINAILSAPASHAANILGNTLAIITKIPETSLTSMIRGDIPVDEVQAEIFGALQGFKDGVRAGLKAYKTGVPSDYMNKIEHQKYHAIPGKTGEIIRIPTRALTAADEFFKSIVYRMELNRQAYLIAKKEGLKGDKLAERIGEIINDPAANKGIFMKARQESLYRTFNKPLGEIGNKIMGIREKDPTGIFKYVAPFIRTPINIAKFALERTPFNFAKVLIDYKKGKISDDQLAEELAKPIIGTLLMGAAFIGALEGMITGGEPKDKKERQLRYAYGWQPYSIKIGDKYYGYNRLEPVGSLMGMAADMAEALVDKTSSPNQKIAKLILSSTKNITSKTFLTGASIVLDVLSDPERWGQVLIERLTGSLVPSGVAAVARAYDPYVREVRNPIDVLMSRIPGLSTKLPYKQGAYDLPQKRPGSELTRLLSPVSASEEKQNIKPIATQDLALYKAGKIINRGYREARMAAKDALQRDDRDAAMDIIRDWQSKLRDVAEDAEKNTGANVSGIIKNYRFTKRKIHNLLQSIPESEEEVTPKQRRTGWR